MFLLLLSILVFSSVFSLLVCCLLIFDITFLMSSMIVFLIFSLVFSFILIVFCRFIFNWSIYLRRSILKRSFAIFVICSILLSSLGYWLDSILSRLFSICVWSSLANFCALFCPCSLVYFWGPLHMTQRVLLVFPLYTFGSFYRQRYSFHCNLRSKVHFGCSLWRGGVHRILGIFLCYRSLLLCDHVLGIWSIALLLVVFLMVHIWIFEDTVLPHLLLLFLLGVCFSKDSN